MTVNLLKRELCSYPSELSFQFFFVVVLQSLTDEYKIRCPWEFLNVSNLVLKAKSVAEFSNTGTNLEFRSLE